MRIYLLILICALLSLSSYATDCPNFALKTSSSSFAINETINLFIADTSIRCKDKNKCFENYASAELVLPNECIESISPFQALTARFSVLSEPWKINCTKQGKYNLKVYFRGGTEDCDENISINILVPLTNEIETTTTNYEDIDTEVPLVSYKTIQHSNENSKIQSYKKKDNSQTYALVIASIILLILILLLLVIAALVKQGSKQKPKNRKLTSMF